MHLLNLCGAVVIIRPREGPFKFYSPHPLALEMTECDEGAYDDIDGCAVVGSMDLRWDAELWRKITQSVNMLLYDGIIVRMPVGHHLKAHAEDFPELKGKLVLGPTVGLANSALLVDGSRVSFAWRRYL